MRTPSLALLALVISVAFSQEADPCKRQPFRGRCPGTSANGQPQRSQFVLRYYLRNGECVSYPYGHCANDDNEPKLFRYKEECEDSCIPNKEVVEVTQPSKDAQTYATMAPKKTECLKQKDLKGSGNLIKGAYVPQCDEHGNFKSLQCEPDGEICFCVDKSGIELANSRCQAGQPKPDCEKIASATPMRSNECSGGVDNGPCQGKIARWYYDEQDLRCKQFDYSGCGGNGNNYPTEVSCNLRCGPPKETENLCHSGLPLKSPEGGLADCSKTSCPTGFKCNVLATQSVCCPDVEKDSEAGVLDVGNKADICALPKERGPCDRYELRFYYSRDLKECKYFFYGGCEGNANNFGKIEECHAACAPEKNGVPTDSTPPPTTPEAIPEVENDSTDALETTEAKVETTTQEVLVKLATTKEAVEEQPQTTETERLSPVATTEADVQSTTEQAREETPAIQQPRGEEQREGEPSTSGQTEQTEPIQAETTPFFEETSEPIQTEAPSTQRPVQTRAPAPVQTRVPVETRAPDQTRPPSPTTSSAPLPVNRCQHPRDSGSCRGKFDRWVWDTEKKVCERFTYSGCGGNGNNFASQEECLSICHVEVTPSIAPEEVDLEHVCEDEIDSGNCKASFSRYGYDKETGDCRQFTYGGCGGNGNNFPSLKDCRRKCGTKIQGTNKKPAHTDSPVLPEDLCEHPVDVGECSGVFTRFAYNDATNDCQQFTYGGCGGNGNNFPNKAECLSACAKVKCPPEPSCDTTHCQFVKDSHGCGFCSCPPPASISHPPLAPTPRVEQQPHCAPLDIARCTEPCIIFSNRHNCKECVCPKLPEAPTLSNNDDIDVPNFGGRAPGFGGRAPAPPSAPGTQRGQKKPDLETNLRGVTNNNIDQNEIPDQIVQQPFPEQPQPSFPRVPTPPPRFTDISEFPSAVSEQCTQRVDPGPCANFVQRWYFNAAQGSCEPFQYGGCAGNRNHFFTERECFVHCQHFVTPRIETTTEREFTAPAQIPQRPQGQQQFVRPPPQVVPQQPRPQVVPQQPQVVAPQQPQVVPQPRFVPQQPQPQFTRPVQIPQPPPRFQEGIAPQQPLVQPTPQVQRRVEQPQISSHIDVPAVEAPRPIAPTPVQIRQFGAGLNHQLEVEVQTVAPPVVQERKNTPLSPPLHPAQPELAFKPFAPPQPELVAPVDESVDMPDAPASLATRAWHFVSKAPVVPEQGFVPQQAIQPVQPQLPVQPRLPVQPSQGPIIRPLPRVLRPLPSDNVVQQIPTTTQNPETQTTQGPRRVVHAKPSLTEANYVAETINTRPFHPDDGLSMSNNPYAGSKQQTPPPNFEIPPQRNTFEVNNRQYIPPQPATIGPNVRPTVNELSNGNPWTSPTMAPSLAGSISGSGKTAEAQPDYSKDAKPAEAAKTESQFIAVKKEKVPEATTEAPKAEEKTTKAAKVEEKTTETPKSEATKETKATEATTKAVEVTTEAAKAEEKTTEAAKETTQFPKSEAAKTETTTEAPKTKSTTAKPTEATVTTEAAKVTEATTERPHTLNIKKIEPEVKTIETEVKASAAKTQVVGTGNAIEKELKVEDKDAKIHAIDASISPKSAVHEGQYNAKKEEKISRPVTSINFDGENVLENTELLHRETYMTPDEKEGLTEFKKPVQDGHTRENTDAHAKQIDIDQDKDLLESSGQEPKTSQGLVEPRARGVIGREGEVLPPENIVPFPEDEEVVIIPKTTYPAETLTTPDPTQTLLPRVASIANGRNYIDGKPLVAPSQRGVPNSPDGFVDPSKIHDLDSKPIENIHSPVSIDGTAVCPNNQKALINPTSGRLEICLPGKKQCPENSVCYFNGLDFFCCPSVDDPYDNHVFGGYDGDEVRHGYKATPLNIKSLNVRARRHAQLPQTSFSIDHITSPLRFDGKAPHKISRADRINPCTEQVKKGSCDGQHLRYFYDINNDECRLFYYSGCDGNTNNFATQSECDKRCKLNKIVERPAPVQEKPVPAGQCPNGQLPLGENAPVLCGNQTDSIGCPQGYYCREGPPDVCCPTETTDLNKVLSPQRQWGDVRRKERVQFNANIAQRAPLPVHQAAFGVPQQSGDKDLNQRIPLPEHKDERVAPEPEDISKLQAELIPSNMCPDGSDALNGNNGKPLVCGAGLAFDGHEMCPRGFYCSMDAERNSRLCCPLEIQSSNVPPPPVLPPYLGHRHANPGEAIGRPSLPSDRRRA